jgi:allophanate hydrolase
MSEPKHPGPTIADWAAAYKAGRLRPSDLPALLARSTSGPAWISPPERAAIEAQLARLETLLAGYGGDTSKLPLYGIPFAVKDNIDAQGWNTTAACPAFAYAPTKDANAVKRLREAGAIVVGKTNLDQFATGLVGSRSPYGEVPNVFRPDIISGGSSSGSAVVVAQGVVPFSLGTDTAGSGRVPAGLNGIVGLKPTRGRFSNAGVVPACRTLDCVSIFARTLDDADFVAGVMEGFDPEDAYSRRSDSCAPLGMPETFRLGVPENPEFFGDEASEACFRLAIASARSLGAEIVPVDFTPFTQLAALLYQGPWVAERWTVVEDLYKRDPGAIHPVVRGIVEGAGKFSAADAFRFEYRRAELARAVQMAMTDFDALMVPTAVIAPTIEEVLTDPLGPNSRLGTYTNFANFADLCALSLPAGMRVDGIPFGVTFLAPAWHDRKLSALGRRWCRLRDSKLPEDDALARPAAPNSVRLAVVGAHLTGMPLNHQLVSRGASFVERTTTSANYRLHAIPGTVPPKPGLERLATGRTGNAIEVELWDLPLGLFGSFVAEVPPPLGIGSVELADGRVVKGFLCEAFALENARDITAFGGWRSYLASLSAPHQETRHV